MRPRLITSSCRGQIFSQGEKGEAGHDFWGEFSSVWQYVALSEKRDASETLRATRYKEAKTSFNLESWDNKNMCFITPSSGGFHQGGSCCHFIIYRCLSKRSVCVSTMQCYKPAPESDVIGAGCQAAGVKLFTGLVSHSHKSKSKNKRREPKWRAAKWDQDTKGTKASQLISCTFIYMVTYVKVNINRYDVFPLKGCIKMF